MDLLLNLEYYRAGIQAGLLTKDNLIDYVLNTIENSDSLPYIYYDLAVDSSKDKYTICSMIKNYFLEKRYSVDKELIYKKLILLVKESYFSKIYSLEDTVYVLSCISRDYFLDEYYYSQMYELEDYFYLAKENIYGTIEQVQKDTEDFLNSFV